MKRPKFSPEAGQQLDDAQTLDTRARIYELGVAAFLGDNMSCAGEVEEVCDVLTCAVTLRKQSREIHDRIFPLGEPAELRDEDEEEEPEPAPKPKRGKKP